MRPSENIENLIKKNRYKLSSETHKKVFENVLREIEKNKEQITGQERPKIRRIIMKNPKIKLAAAAVIIIAVFAGMHFTGNPFSATVTFAKVISPLLNARTASLDTIIGSQVIHDEVMGQRIHRTVSGIDNSMIIDLGQKKMLMLNNAGKTALIIDLGGLDGIQNYLESLRDVVIKLMDGPDFHVDNKGLQKLDDKEYLVFVAESENHTITIWADPETILPIRIEDKTPNMNIVCDNLQFDIDLDESLFSLDIPEGYKIQNTGIDFSNKSESDFIETLRIWAQIIEDGYFPESIDLGDLVKIGSKFDQGMKRLGLTEQEQIETATKWGQGLVFLRFFNGQGQWHYAGEGIKLGDAHTPIFWYQPKNSPTWRVIYGDLSVKDVTKDNLPRLSDWQIKYQEATKQWEETAFTGTEIDKWYIISPSEIIAYSDITLTKIPQDVNTMYIKLPYASAVLEKVTLNDDEIQFAKIINDRYELFLPISKLHEGTTKLECLWSLPLDTLKTEDGSYRTRLQGLIPVEAFEVSTVLNPGCGFQNSKDPSQTQVMFFKTNKIFTLSESGSCGFLIEKIK